MLDKKNYSFYMPDNFSERLEVVTATDSKLSALSKSQALYYIISRIAESIENQSADLSWLK